MYSPKRASNDDVFEVLSDIDNIEEDVYTWRGGLGVTYYLDDQKVAELDYMLHKSKMLVDEEFAEEHDIEVE